MHLLQRELTPVIAQLNCDTDADGHFEIPDLHLLRYVANADQYLLRQPVGAAKIGILQEYGELFTAKTSRESPLLMTVSNNCPISRNTLSPIALPIAVIDSFDVVSIDVEEGTRTHLPRREQYLALHLQIEPHARFPTDAKATAP